MFSSELSDEQVLYQRSKWTVSERVLEPLEMSDTEILDWMNEYSDGANTTPLGGWFLSHERQAFWGANVRDAVCTAAAHQKEVNRDF